MKSLICAIVKLHDSVFQGIQCIARDWFLGLSARLVFSSVLLMFFINSALTKVGSGFPGFLIPQFNAYAQILPSVAEAAGYDASKIAFFPWGIIVALGTYAEFILPVLILLGLFTRLASVGMIGFIAVMTIVDVVEHKVDAKTVGVLFDRIQDSVIADQRLLWLLPLFVLIVIGPGKVSLDYLLGKITGR